ncbi:DinB family protein [Alkalihalobacillus sp. MEB130]|uniref:DinB family protein n=1 Tax=Alkalihalobacillus sp. MEB130 TaxID=2976704 RepID=UPI0028DDBA63|nr:DinB family protein [Alkalihalobacillus sp. MEB130]MDT8861397.1 DinB family protein [Alkalihalobacillus sp. MEB130]
MSKNSHFKGYFLSHRLITNELINKIDKEHYDFKPTETSMSAKELVVHMLTSFYQFASAAAKQAPKPLHDEKAEIDLANLATLYTDETVKIFESLTDEQFDEIIDLTAILGVKLPAEQIINLAIDHEINHKGNLFVYVREMGHTDLPMFVKK